MYHGISVSITYTQMHSQLIYYFPSKNSGGLTDQDESKFKVVLERRDREAGKAFKGKRYNTMRHSTRTHTETLSQRAYVASSAARLCQ